MKQRIYYIFIIIVLFCYRDSFGYFYHLCVIKKTTPAGLTQYIVLLADYHDKNHQANNEQRAYFESLLERNRNKKIKLIIEDLSSVNNDGRMICCQYGIKCGQGVLGYLAHKARSFGILVDNVEYRYCRVVGIGPLINNIDTDPHSFKSSCIPLGLLYKEIINEIEKIKKYDDGKKFNAFYRNILADINNKLSSMHLAEDINQKKTVAHHCVQLRRKKYREELEKLCIFDSGLIDINILHSIACCDIPIIFVLAGGSHIEQVKSILRKNEYEEIFSTPSDRAFEPIDISLLNKILY